MLNRRRVLKGALATIGSLPLAAPAIVHQLRELGAEPSPGTPEELAAYVKDDTAFWERLIRERKLKRD